MIALAAITAARVLAAFLLPATSDEAYYILWSKHPAWGYYDHPPLVAWLGLPLGALPWLGIGFYRLFPILAVLAVGLGLYRLLRPSDETRARLVCLIYLTTPQAFLHIVVTPEFPLLLTVSGAAWLYLRAARSGHRVDYFVSGLLLGCAMLTKYLAVLLAAGIVLHALWQRPKNWGPGLILIAAGTLPAVGINLAWNASNCWANLAILMPRFSLAPKANLLSAIATFLVGGVLMLTPWVSWQLVAAWRRAKNVPYADGRWLFLAAWAALVIGTLAIVPGLNWLLAFFPLAFPALAALQDKTLWKVLRANIALSAIVSVALAVATVALPPRLDWKYNHDLVLTFDAKAICEQMERFAGGGAELATFDYSQSSVLSVGCRRFVLVIGEGGTIGRAFDAFTDFRQLDGKMIVAIHQSPISPDAAGGALVDAQYREIQQRGRPFYLVKGTLSYQRYRDTVLARITDRYYGCTGLPGRCSFREQYFPNRGGCGPVAVE